MDTGLLAGDAQPGPAVKYSLNLVTGTNLIKSQDLGQLR